MILELRHICSRLSSGNAIHGSHIKERGLYPVFGGNGLRGYTNSYNFKGECAIIGRQGAACGNVRYFAGKAFMTEHAVVAEPNDSHNARYLAAILSLMNLGQLSGQSAQPGLSVKLLSRLTINMPRLETQQKAAVILHSLDRKINFNNRINDYLEALFALIYRRFLYENDCDYVPLPDVVFFQEGPGIRNWQYVHDGRGVNFINIRCIQQGHDIDLSNANQISQEEAYGKYSHFLVEAGDLLMSTSGTLGRYAIARAENLPLCMNTSVIRFRPLSDPEAYAFVYGYLTSQEFYSHLTSMATGSAQVNFGPMHLKRIEMPLPSDSAVRAFNKKAKPLIKYMIAMHAQNEKLARCRDTLLPKLMSGEIDVSQVDITQLNNHLYDC